MKGHNMAKRKADMTDAQKVTLENDKFRAELRAQALDEAGQAPVNEDLETFRKETYRQALREAKANQ